MFGRQSTAITSSNKTLRITLVLFAAFTITSHSNAFAQDASIEEQIQSDNESVPAPAINFTAFDRRAFSIRLRQELYRNPIAYRSFRRVISGRSDAQLGSAALRRDYWDEQTFDTSFGLSVGIASIEWSSDDSYTDRRWNTKWRKRRE